MNKHIRRIPALALGMAVLSTPTLATAATTVNVVSAELVAKGAGVLVSAEVTCTVGSNSHLFADAFLIQRAGNKTTQGSGFSSSDGLTCDGTPQSIQVLVTPFEKIFRQGAAIVRFDATACDEFFNVCESGQDTQEVQLTK